MRIDSYKFDSMQDFTARRPTAVITLPCSWRFVLVALKRDSKVSPAFLEQDFTIESSDI